MHNYCFHFFVASRALNSSCIMLSNRTGLGENLQHPLRVRMLPFIDSRCYFWKGDKNWVKTSLGLHLAEGLMTVTRVATSTMNTLCRNMLSHKGVMVTMIVMAWAVISLVHILLHTSNAFRAMIFIMGSSVNSYMRKLLSTLWCFHGHDCSHALDCEPLSVLQ